MLDETQDSNCLRRNFSADSRVFDPENFNIKYGWWFICKIKILLMSVEEHSESGINYYFIWISIKFV